jgi:GNAT superfamily N-acetyltransferase
MDLIKFRQPKAEEFDACWKIVDQARNNMIRLGSTQWTEYYPSREIIMGDFLEGNAFVLEKDGNLLAYGVLAINGEPAYEHIDGKWLSNDEYVAVHRLAVLPELQGLGVGRVFLQETERYCKSMGIHSIKIDTHRENKNMISLLSQLGYVICGQVDYGEHGRRFAFEKRV